MIERSGAVRIAEERQRQIDKEGYDRHHDDEHTDYDLALAAACYAASAGGDRIYVKTESSDDSYSFDNPWPWDDCDDKRLTMYTNKERVRMLEKAGALIAAEIDRLLRATENEGV